jgi:hypothetical protein
MARTHCWGAGANEQALTIIPVMLEAMSGNSSKLDALSLSCGTAPINAVLLAASLRSTKPRLDGVGISSESDAKLRTST